MRQIDEMSSDELEVLKLKGMLSERNLDRRTDDRIADELDCHADAIEALDQLEAAQDNNE